MKRKHETPTEFERSDTAAIIREGEGADADGKMGKFGAALATNGEASDGHILHIKGNKTPGRMSLLFGHRSDALTPSLGSVTEPKKGKSADGKLDVLRTKQVINMEGEGQMADIRRNVALLVHNADLNGMSVRWVPDEVVRRIDLAHNHYAFVDPATESRDSERYWGYFHKSSHNQEGSVVAVGADPGALIGRAQELKGEPSAVFFRSLAHSIETGERADGMGQLSTAFTAYSEAMQGMRKAGVSPDDLAMMVGLDTKPEDMVQYQYIGVDGSLASTMILRTALEALVGESSQAYTAAVGLAGEVVKEARDSLAARARDDTDDDAELTPEELDVKHNRVHPQRRKEPRKPPSIVNRPPEERTTVADLAPSVLFRALGEEIGAQMRTVVAQATGRIED